MDEVKQRLPLSIQLAAMSVSISLLIAIPMGIVCAIRQDTWIDYLFRVISIGGLALPTFWTAILVILILSIFFGWMPALGYVPPWEDPLKNIQQLMWPAITLGYYFTAYISRMTRSCMLEVLREDYVRTAWAKGLRERTVVYRHALKNAMLPVVTLAGIEFGVLIGGTVIQETIFSLPGMGKNLVDSIFHRDYPMVQAIIVIICGIFALVNLFVDIMYAYLDPRIHYR